ncbi:MAG: coproporphyrinogen III oxidase, partial [Bacteroidetes bacterium]|nr:coproporphyrinogen III oxidase [Bacteroidota bacterium]
MPVRSDTFPLDLVETYNRPGPRYTSYPTAPHFTDAFGPSDYLSVVEEANDGPHGDLSLYVHLP